MRNINEIIIHCSATPEGKEFHASDIDRWHREQGYNSIGYHYVITLDGKIEKGRDAVIVGAHCKGHNLNSIGICYIGGIDKHGRPADTRTEAQKKAILELCQTLQNIYPIRLISGHRSYANKDCPCFDVRRWAHDVELMPYTSGNSGD